jgi:hypothetical protein
MRNYRRSHARLAPKTPPCGGSPPDLISLLERAKNNVAIDLNTCPGRVFIISSDKRVKNTLATAELILVEVLTSNEHSSVLGKEHLFGSFTHSSV